MCYFMKIGEKKNERYQEKDKIFKIDAVCFCAFKDVFHERVKLYKAWKEDEATLTKKREAKVRLELTHKTDKIGSANQEIAEVSLC